MTVLLCVRMCVGYIHVFEYTHEEAVCLMSSFITLCLVFETSSLTEPKTY